MPRKPRGGTVGRPLLTPDKTTVRTTVTLKPDQAAWLSSQQGGASAAVRRLIDEARGG